MKKWIVLVAALAVSLPLLAGDDRPISKDRLPAPAKEFIARHFASMEISLATMDKEMFDTTYEVFFIDGSKVEFGRNGLWQEIDCKYGRVPEAALPEGIRTYLQANQPDRFVKEIDRDKHDYEVKLDNGLELKFDLGFRLIGYDH